MSSLQRYFGTLFNRGQLNKSQIKKLRPQNAIVVRAYALPKFHKSCTLCHASKTVFTANKKLYQHIDGVSMGSCSLGLLLANIKMTELEWKVMKQFIDDKILIFYDRYADDTLVVIKPEDLNRVHNALTNFALMH